MLDHLKTDSTEKILKGEINSPTKFKLKFYSFLEKLEKRIYEEFKIVWTNDELGNLLVSICRTNEFDVVVQSGKKLYLQKDNVWKWICDRLIPNTVILDLFDTDVLRLLLFSIEITYKMLFGGTKATTTQKAFRGSRRSFETIISNQFSGKLGEVLFKKFANKEFPEANIQLDWEISEDIEKHRNDIPNSTSLVSIKTSPALTGVWGEASIGYDYGIMMKCSVPKESVFSYFIQTGGFNQLIQTIEGQIPEEDILFKKYCKDISDRLGDFQKKESNRQLKGFVLGFFKTSDYNTVKKGVKLNWLGEVNEERYLVRIDELKNEKEDWEVFLTSNNLMEN